MDRSDAYDVVDGERAYQDAKWGAPREHPHEVGGWLMLMRVHLAKAEAAWSSHTGDQPALIQLRKVLALGVACAEEHGLPSRPGFEPPDG